MPSSTSSPPSYKTHTGSQEERLYTQHPSSYHAKLGRDDFADNKSTKSGSFIDNPSADLAALKAISGGRVRKGKCPPEFLAEVAKSGIPHSVLEKYGASKFRIIAGKEGTEFYERFLGETDTPCPLYDDVVARQDIPPVVFAVPVFDAVGRQCVDYYMTWRGKTRVHDLKGAERRPNILEDEFKVVDSVINKEYKKAVKAASSRASSGSGKSSSSRKREHVYQMKENVAPSTSKRPSPEITIPEPAAQVPESPVSAVSANASVISIPTLTQIRGVPLSHHLPLRVANPDPETASTVDDAPGRPTSRYLETLVETAENGPSNENAVSEETLVDHTSTPHAPPAVIRPPSSESGSDRSSRSSKSSRSRESRRDRDRDNEGHHHHHESSRRHSTREHDRDHDRHREKKHSSKHDDSRRKKVTPLGDEEFVIVVLDDKLSSDNTWHGIQRQPSTRTPSRAPSVRSSPWAGPLAQQDFITRRYPAPRTHHHSPLDSGESEEESSDSDIEGWNDSPVIPLKPYMEAMGYVTPAAHAPYPVVPNPSPVQYQRPLATGFNPRSPASMASYNSPYPVVSTSLPSSPYVPAWMKLTPQQQHTPLPRSAYTPSPIYASPYAQHPQVARY